LAEDYRSLIRRLCGDVAVLLPGAAELQLTRYCEELDRWNRKINLTALGGEALVRKLIVEPVWIAATLQIAGVCIDIGSGNGSPAIPVHCLGKTAMHMVEARIRRAAFLRHLSSALELENAWVHRAELRSAVAELPVADWISMQAVNPSADLLLAVQRISKPSTALLWITSETTAHSRFAGSKILSLPFSQTVAVVIRARRDPF
jgi:16S rRNA (guanine527-N7)-methyltransferase